MVRRASLVLGVVAALWVTASAIAADPSASTSPAPSAGPSDGSFDFGPQVWLDTALPADAAAGQVIEVGLTVWEPTQGILVPIDGMYVRILPASGQGKPTEAAARSDWTGHLLAQTTVPAGGAGAVAVGFHGEQCDASNVCTPVDVPIRVMGVGPPPDAPRSLLVDAGVGWPSAGVVAGVPFDLEVHLEPRAAWDPAALHLPDRIIITVRKPRDSGPDMVNTEIRSIAPLDGAYLGSVTIPEAGDVVLSAAIPGTSGPDETIDASVTRLTVLAPDALGAPEAPVPTDRPGPPVSLLAGLGALVIVAGLLIRRVFADL